MRLKLHKSSIYGAIFASGVDDQCLKLLFIVRFYDKIWKVSDFVQFSIIYFLFLIPFDDRIFLVDNFLPDNSWPIHFPD